MFTCAGKVVRNQSIIPVLKLFDFSPSDGRVNQTYSYIRLDPDFVADYVARSRQNTSETAGGSSNSDIDTRQADQTGSEETSTR